MVLLFKVQRSSEQASNHGGGSDALHAFKPDKQEIAWVYSGHDGVICLESPADPETLVG